MTLPPNKVQSTDCSNSLHVSASGEMNLNIMLANSRPIMNPGEYLFISIDDATLERLPRSATVCEIKEKMSCHPSAVTEGTTIVIEKEMAKKYGVEPKDDYVASWITLEVQSSLEAIGLTAVFAKELGAAGISANVIAGYYHDHIFVDLKDKKSAEETLLAMSKKYASMIG